MIRNFAITLGKRFKGPLFDIDPDLPLSALLAFAVYRSFALIRGLWVSLFLHPNSAHFIFVGSRSKFKTSRRIRIARGVTIGDCVLIQGLSRKGVNLGEGVSIGANTIIMPTSVMRNLGEGFEIGRNSGIGQNSFIGCGGGVRIGENVIMGQFVSFHTENHNFNDLETPIIAQGVVRKEIVIEDDVWVGVKATFLSGAHVGKGCIVAAGAVVRGFVPPYSIVGGVPAKVIATRL